MGEAKGRKREWRPVGPEERFRALYQSTRPRLIAYALRRSSSPEDAADVVAEVFTVAWRRLDDIPDDERCILWLYATARRVMANHTRRLAHRADVVQRIGTEAATTFATRLGADDDEAVEAALALARMSEDDREILMLVGWEGLDSTQLAGALGCSPTAARIRLHRARARLTAEFDELGVWSKHTPDSRQLHRGEAVSEGLSGEA
jgi:RNA polymerase sigma factor (sigma-70 family)